MIMISFVTMFSECVPDPSSFEAGSDMGKLVGKIRKMLSEAETENQSELGPTYDHVGGKVTLQSLGLKLGGKVRKHSGTAYLRNS